MFRAGDPKMINDFSQAELCPPPPMCRAPLPSAPASSQEEEDGVRMGWVGGARRRSLRITKKMPGREPCVIKARVS